MGLFDKFKKKDDADSLTFKGIKLTEKGKYLESLEFFDKALELNPNKFQAWQIKGISLDEIGRYEEAVEAYNKALKIFDFGASKSEISKALKLDSNYSETWYEKGVTLKIIGRTNEALECLDKVLELDPEHQRANEVKNKILENN